MVKNKGGGIVYLSWDEQDRGGIGHALWLGQGRWALGTYSGTSKAGWPLINDRDEIASSVSRRGRRGS
jgi:hypothetical protein